MNAHHSMSALVAGLSLALAVACSGTPRLSETSVMDQESSPVEDLEGTNGSGPARVAPDPTDAEAAAVAADPRYEVEVTEDVVYAKGLSHAAGSGAAGAEMDLLLDVYEPVRFDGVPMPAVVLIHGGGFTGGSKQAGPLVDMAYWFAERGWVAYSIDYRVARDRGTVPAAYPDVPAAATRSQAEQWQALYPACRDAKAAIRWVRATADEYSVHPDHIAAIGGSAGSFLAVTLGVSDDADCTAEVSVDDDPTLLTTNLGQSSEVATVIDHWGGALILSVLELGDGADRFDPTDAPVSIVHGTNDPTVPFSEAEAIRDAYERTGVTYAWHPLDGVGHGAWNAVIDGQSLVESAADFIIETQSLTVG